MARATFDNPFYFFTSVTHHRLKVFRTDIYKELPCNALNEARESSGILFFAYGIMADHMHILTDGKRSPSDSLRFLNGITARRIIDHLKQHGPEESIRKLQLETKDGDYKYSLWEHHSDKFLITSESMFMQKMRYINNNPVEAGISESLRIIDFQVRDIGLEKRYSTTSLLKWILESFEKLKADLLTKSVCGVLWVLTSCSL